MKTIHRQNYNQYASYLRNDKKKIEFHLFSFLIHYIMSRVSNSPYIQG